MNYFSSPQFEEDYAALSKTIQKKIDKQLQFLAQNLRHPSLRAKKYDESNDIWQARIDHHYRFYFTTKGKCATLDILIKSK